MLHTYAGFQLKAKTDFPYKKVKKKERNMDSVEKGKK